LGGREQGKLKVAQSAEHLFANREAVLDELDAILATAILPFKTTY